MQNLLVKKVDDLTAEEKSEFENHKIMSDYCSP